MKRTLIVPLVGLALMVPALATAASGHRAKIAGKPVHLTQELFQYTSTGAPPLSGSNSYVGTSDGRIGAASVHGALRGFNNYTGGGNFTGKNVIFEPAGSIDISFSAQVTAPGQFSGAGRFTGGTGRYKGARGKFTFTAAQQRMSSIVRILKGRISFR